MKKFYTLKASFMNGTVTMMTDISNYTDKEVAEEVMGKIIENNKCWDVYCEIIETCLYENRDEVPILNEKKE